MDQPSHADKQRTEWWDRLDRLVEEASARPAAERAAFLERACPSDPGMRAEAASLLAHAGSGENYLSSLAASLLPERCAVTGNPAGLDPFIGQTIHQYTIESRLGSGGMGVVYRARDTRLGRTVALKFIWPYLNADDIGRRRLLVEARAAAALDHVNVCTVYEVGESPVGGLFIAMAYYDGETLKEKLARGQLTLREAVSLLRQIAEGVGAAHARGVIHCDIKPGNILITPEGTAKLLDFGIADQGIGALNGPARTVGTPAYMSPEQLRGEVLDARSDVWALGVLAYEMIASRRPFHGSTSAATAQAVLTEAAPPLADSIVGIPPVLDQVIQQMLDKDPASRTQSVADFLGGLDRAMAAVDAEPGSTGSVVVSNTAWAVRSGRVAAVVLAASALLMVASALPGGPLLLPPRDEAESTHSAAGLHTGDESAAASIVVLRFEDPAAASPSWVTDGMTEGIQAEMRRIDGLRVVGHFTSLMVSDVPPAEALFGNGSRRRYLLSGAVRTSNDSIWVTPRLSDADGTQLWEGTHAAALTPESMKDIPRQVARAAARALALSPPAHTETAAMPEPATYESYLEGRYHLRRFQSGVVMTAEELQRGVGYFRQVVERAPAWAPGHAALGEALSWVGMFEAEQGRLDAAFDEAGAALERALALDPNDARAHATLGYVLHRRDLDFAAAEARFRRALELDPDQYWHCGYGFFLLWSGRYEEATQVYRRAEVRDPLYLILKDFLAASYLCTGRYEDAIATSETVLRAYPSMAPVRRSLVLALHASGREDEAFQRIAEATQPDHPYWDILRALLHARSGRTSEAESLLRGLDEAAVTKSMRAIFPSRQISPAPLYAAVLVALDRPDDAVDMLASALDRDPAVLLYDRCYPELQTLADDPRYQALLQRSGVPF